MNSRSTFLFTVPDALDGLAMVLNVAGNNHTIYLTSDADREADLRALRHDWNAYGDELTVAARRAMPDPQRR